MKASVRNSESAAATRPDVPESHPGPDTLLRENLDRIVRLAARQFDVPIALVSLVHDDGRQAVISHGIENADRAQRIASSAHGNLQERALVVPDVLGESDLRDNPIVKDIPGIKFYARAPLGCADDGVTGALCLLDTKPHGPLTDCEKALLTDFTALITNDLNLHAQGLGLETETRRQKEVERRLQESEHKLALIVENAPAGIAVVNRDMQYLAVSRRWCEDYNLVGQNLIGRSHYEIFPEIPQQWREDHQRCLSGEALKFDQDFLQRSDGTIHWLCRQLHPWLDADGNVGGLIFFNDVITAQKHAADALERNQRFLTAVMESIQDGIVACDADGHLTVLNAAAKRMLATDLLNVPPDQWPEKYQIYEPDGKTLLTTERLPLVRALNGEIVKDEEFVLAQNVESPRRVIANARALTIRDDVKIGAVVSMEDITERVEIEARYRQAQKMEAMGQLTGGLAHDFNNLLAIILGNLQLLQRSLKDDGKAGRRLGSAIKATQRGAELTSRLLVFSRKQTLEVKPVHVSELISGLTDMLSRTFGKSIELATVLNDGDWIIEVDENRLEASILNLCINARDAMPEGGRLTIESRKDSISEKGASSLPDLAPGDYVVISVTDTGHGIPESIRGKVFDPFFTTKEPGCGSGLGLSMVYGFIKQSGGHVKIHSDEGRSTTVSMYIPRGLAPLNRTEQQDLPRLEAYSGTERILIVEDDSAVRDVVISLLEVLGYQTTQAANAQAALEILSTSSDAFDLMLTDIVMPGKLKGLALARIVRQKFPHIKILFTSGYVGSDPLHNGDGLGAARLVNKPFRLEDLAKQVRDALDAHVD